MYHYLKSFSFLIVLALAAGCSQKTYTADIDTSYYRMNYKHKSDSKIDQMIAPYKKQLDAQMNDVIAYNPKEMKKARPNSVLGNWFSDALLEEAELIYGREIDMAAQNYGGLRVPSLKAGDITVGNIYELMPFDNKLVLLEMSGKITKQLLDRIAEKGGWPISSTLSFTIKNNKATNIKIKGEDFDITKSYTIALADYVANGGDKCYFLSESKRIDKDVMIRDIIIDHLKRKSKVDNTINADASPRIN